MSRLRDTSELVRKGSRSPTFGARSAARQVTNDQIRANVATSTQVPRQRAMPLSQEREQKTMCARSAARYEPFHAGFVHIKINQIMAGKKDVGLDGCLPENGQPALTRDSKIDFTNHLLILMRTNRSSLRVHRGLRHGEGFRGARQRQTAGRGASSISLQRHQLQPDLERGWRHQRILRGLRSDREFAISFFRIPLLPFWALPPQNLAISKLPGR